MADTQQSTWGIFARIIVKALLLFALCNLIFALVYPMAFIGQMSLYGVVFPARSRLPYSANSALDYSVTVTNIPALFASHEISRPKADDEFHVILLGDSNTWGFLLEHDATLAATITQAGATIGDKRIVAYNLGYPELSLTKDLLILDAAMSYEPDMIIWLVTLESFAESKRLATHLEQNNPDVLRPLIAEYGLQSDSSDARFVEPDFFQRTIIGQRRNLADLWRLQSYGVAWTATTIDQHIGEYDLRQSDFENDVSWQNFAEPVDLTRSDLAFDVLAAGVEISADVPLVIINEPMFISDGQNSDLRYNSFYPHWAYDDYRVLLADIAAENNWRYLDWWDAIAPDEFTDTPVHLTRAGTQQVSMMILECIENNAG